MLTVECRHSTSPTAAEEWLCWGTAAPQSCSTFHHGSFLFIFGTIRCVCVCSTEWQMTTTLLFGLHKSCTVHNMLYISEDELKVKSVWEAAAAWSFHFDLTKFVLPQSRAPVWETLEALSWVNRTSVIMKNSCVILKLSLKL